MQRRDSLDRPPRGPFDAVGQDPVVGLRFDAVGHRAADGDCD